MDDKTFIAKYAADETTRINERLKKLVASPTPPTDEEKEAVMADIETTLARLKSALSNITEEMLEDTGKNDKTPQ